VNGGAVSVSGGALISSQETAIPPEELGIRPGELQRQRWRQTRKTVNSGSGDTSFSGCIAWEGNHRIHSHGQTQF
jgi:hypothetical protein